MQKRYALLYLIRSQASAFACILAFGLMQMKGLGGLNGWNWISTLRSWVQYRSLSHINTGLIKHVLATFR